MMKLAQYLTEHRRQHRWSLREVAERCGLSHSYLADLERGYSPKTGKEISPTVDALRKLAKGYQVPYESLERVARGLPPEPSPETGLTPEVLRLAKELMEVPEEKRDAIRKLLGL